MDAIKFAFETTIVGLLALPWLALLLMIFLPKSRVTRVQHDTLFSRLFEPAVLSIVIFTVAYFMGSAVLPVSTQLLDDPDMPIRKIREIRADLNDAHFSWFLNSSLNRLNTTVSYAVREFTSQCHENNGGAQHITSPKWRLWRSSRDDQSCWQRANDLFLIQEQLVLQQGTDKTERISRLHEQVMVLRGAVLNVFIFTSLCWFAYFSPHRQESVHSGTAHVITLFKAVTSFRAFQSHRRVLFKAVMWLCFFSLLLYVSIALGKPDLLHHDITDPPIMESVLFVLAGIGVFALLNGVEKHSHLVVALLFGFGLMLLAYGAWQWTEVLYTEETIAAFFTVD